MQEQRPGRTSIGRSLSRYQGIRRFALLVSGTIWGSSLSGPFTAQRDRKKFLLSFLMLCLTFCARLRRGTGPLADGVCKAVRRESRSLWVVPMSGVGFFTKQLLFLKILKPFFNKQLISLLKCPCFFFFYSWQACSEQGSAGSGGLWVPRQRGTARKLPEYSRGA